MAETRSTDGAPALLGVTFRRAAVMGRLYIAIGLAYIVVLSVAVSFSSPQGFVSAFALFVPIFGVLGSMGGLMVFSSDRIKGVLEYLIAYGVSPRRLFVNILLASLLLATIVLVVSTVVASGTFVGTGHALPAAFAELLLVYSIPMTYASVAFAVMVGMYWTSLSSPRSGMNSPVGLVPLVGIAPSLATLVTFSVLAATGTLALLAVTGTAVLLLVLTVVLLLSRIGHQLPPERLLSPA